MRRACSQPPPWTAPFCRRHAPGAHGKKEEGPRSTSADRSSAQAIAPPPTCRWACTCQTKHPRHYGWTRARTCGWTWYACRHVSRHASKEALAAPPPRRTKPSIPSVQTQSIDLYIGMCVDMCTLHPRWCTPVSSHSSQSCTVAVQ